jgi:hypothetical protein
MSTSQKNKKLYSYLFSIITQIYVRVSNDVAKLQDEVCMIWFKGVSAL